MSAAAHSFVDLDELNIKAGEVIARHTGAEAGLITAGASAGMLLQAAAVMAGTDPARIKRLPDTTGMKDEIVIHRVSPRGRRQELSHGRRKIRGNREQRGRRRLGIRSRDRRQHRRGSLYLWPSSQRRSHAGASSGNISCARRARSRRRSGDAASTREPDAVRRRQERTWLHTAVGRGSGALNLQGSCVDEAISSKRRVATDRPISMGSGERQRSAKRRLQD